MAYSKTNKTVKFFLIGFFLPVILFAFILTRDRNNKPIKSAKYYINIPDSPHVKGAWKELDYVSNDTAYYNWYWRE